MDHYLLCKGLLKQLNRTLRTSREECRKDECTLTSKRHEIRYTLMLIDLVDDLKKQIGDNYQASKLPANNPKEWGIFIQACATAEIVNHHLTRDFDTEAWVYDESPYTDKELEHLIEGRQEMQAQGFPDDA